MDSITVGQMTFRWNGHGLTVTTPTGQDEIGAADSMQLLAWLYDLRQDIYQARHNLPEWARAHQRTETPLLEGPQVQIYEEGHE